MAGRKVLVEYHCEPEGWWAESPDLPGFSAAGATFEEVREQAHAGAEFYLEEPVEVEDRVPIELGAQQNTAPTSHIDVTATVAGSFTHIVASVVRVVDSTMRPAVPTTGKTIEPDSIPA